MHMAHMSSVQSFEVTDRTEDRIFRDMLKRLYVLFATSIFHLMDMRGNVHFWLSYVFLMILLQPLLQPKVVEDAQSKIQKVVHGVVPIPSQWPDYVPDWINMSAVWFFEGQEVTKMTKI